MKKKCQITCLLLLLARLGTELATASFGTAFTYQGQLAANGSPANGSYDLRFMVFNTPGGISILLGSQTNAAVPVTNGLFTSMLDFGGDVFTGGGRWLEIGVRTNGGGGFTALSPRQQLTPARSVLECGSPLPLSGCGRPPQSARGLTHSTTWRGWLLCFFLLHSAFCPRARGQTYTIDWSTIDGGGGTSTGVVCSVTGTIGQPDAGTLSGGQYTLQGGFWGVIAAVQTPGAPLLSIARTTTNTVAVTWPSPSTGWTLQQNTNSVSSVSWSNVTSGIQDNGTTKSVIINPPAGNRFFRLRSGP